MSAHRKYANNAERQAAYRARNMLQGKTRRGSMEETMLPRTPRTLGHRRWDAIVGQACSLLETAIGEMEAYYEEKSEAWQGSERGDLLSEKVESTQEIVALMRDLL